MWEFQGGWVVCRMCDKGALGVKGLFECNLCFLDS